MRVAFLTAGDTARLTGGYLYHARVFAGLRQRGVEVTQIVASPDASAEAQRRAAPSLAARRDEILSADVVMVDALARLACAPWLDRWQAARPLVAMVHELPSVAGGAGEPEDLDAEARLLGADIAIAVSGHGRALLEARGVAPERIIVASPGSDRLPATPAWSVDRHRALCVAQWIPRKGIDTLVRAWTLLDPPGWTLQLIGETTADPAYAATVRQALDAAPESVVVSGAVDDAALARAYAEAGLFALPSRYEGYGMVYAEALLRGLPVVACDVGPVPELVGPKAGLLVPPGDHQALAAALARVMGDDALRERLARGAARRGRELPAWDDTVERVLDALRLALERREVAGINRPR